MCDEPGFLDDETLLENLDEIKAQRVLNWLVLVNTKAPQDIGHALYLARELNQFYKPQTDEDRESHLFHIEPDCNESFCMGEVNDTDIFDRIMSQLEDKYV